VFGVIKRALILYDANGEVTYWENSDGDWCKREFDAEGNVTYREDSILGVTKISLALDKREIEDENNACIHVIFREDSIQGVISDKREIEKVERSELAEKLSKITDEQLDDLALVARFAKQDAIRKDLQQMIEQIIEIDRGLITKCV
jgi:hypothetical protein